MSKKGISVDDAAAGSIEALVADADSRAPAFAASVGHFGADSPQVAAYVDLGIRLSGGYVHTRQQLTELRRWRDIGPDGRRNAVLMDNTTITAATGLLTADSDTLVTALSLWDLARFVDAVVAYDTIHHFGNPAVDDVAVNVRLGGEIVRPVAFPVAFSNDPPAALVVQAWQTTTSVMETLAAGPGGPNGMLDDLLAGWSSVVGQRITVADIIDPQYVWDEFHSPSDLLLAQLAELTRGVPVTELDLAVRLGEKLRRRVLIECNYRGHVTQQLANLLDLPYRASIARVPFRRLDRWLPHAIEDQLLSIAYADEAYAKRLAAVRQLPRFEIRLPVLLAVLLRRSARRASLWPELAQLREEASRYRARRAELDVALSIGDDAVVKKVAVAVAGEVAGLEERYATNEAALRESAVTTAEAMTAVASNPVGLIGPALSGLFAAARALLPPDLGRRIIWQMTRPQFRFLSDIRAESRGITLAMPRIQSLWLVSDAEAEALADRFARFGDFAADRPVER